MLFGGSQRQNLTANDKFLGNTEGNTPSSHSRNLSSHKKAGVREAIASAGAKLLYLPPYSPDFNPIELAFSKFKWLLRSAAERTVETLWQTCGTLLDRFLESECRNYFRHCGYRYTNA